MIKVKKSRLGGAITFIEYWFSDNVGSWDFIRPVAYVQSSRTKWKFGYISERFCTKLINLERPEAEIKSSIRKNFFNLARRAASDGVTFEESVDWGSFVNMYNRFAAVKGISNLLPMHFADMADNLKLFVALFNNKILVAHVYIVDNEQLLARQLHVAYDTSNSSKDYLAFIGNVNRFIHWESILYFKRQSFKTFDLGGYSEDPKLAGINLFKDNFGGDFVVQRNFYSIALVFALFIKKICGMFK